MLLSTNTFSKGDHHLIQTTAMNSAFIKGQFLQKHSVIKIPKGKTVVLDLTEFNINFEKYYNIYNNKKPNVISIISGNNKYRLPLINGVYKYILNSKNLQPVEKSIPFINFNGTDKLWFIVGVDRYENNKYIVNPMWLGIVNIIQ